MSPVMHGCTACADTSSADGCWEHSSHPARYQLTPWPPEQQPAVLLRDTPEDRERLAKALTGGTPVTALKRKQADAIIAGLRGTP